jgi:cell division protein FtsQ
MARGEKSEGIRWGLWFRVVLWGAASVSVLVAATKVRQFAFSDPAFTLAGPDDRNGGLEMQGLMYTSRSKVLNTFANDFGHSVFSLPLAERRRRLLGIDWVEDASVSRMWPNRVMVRVTERKPVAFVNLPRPHGRDGRVVLIDSEGVLLDQPPQSTFTFPVLSGVYEEQSEPERRRRVRAMLRLLADLGPFAKNVSEVNARVTEDLRIMAQVDRRTVELLVGDRNFSSRVQNFASRYAEVRRRSPEAAIFDLRLDDRITARE